MRHTDGTRSTDVKSALSVDARRAAPEIRTGYLQMGGSDPRGRSIAVTSYFMEQDGRPWLPVMGEFHYSRFPRQYWDEELAKIKAGGVDIVATYVFWVQIEEREGVFDWTADRDLRTFVQLCAAHGLQIIVRLGPFCHGECRNGGLPDWLYGRPFSVRSTDERFLSYVRRLYGEISAQIAGLLFKDGGPVIGVQLDNEYMHAGAPWETTARSGTEWVPAGNEGPAYMRALKDLAVECGMEVPLYTCTAWTGSPVLERETLPTHVGYAYTPWIPDPAYVQPPTNEFLFRDRHARPLLSGVPTYDPSCYPYATSELGGGIQITYYHRPVVSAACVEAMAVVALGSGTNLLGYYMYHGGSNPTGHLPFLNEYTIPRISYDFQAPIREFGQLAESFGALKLLHHFIHAFGSLLAPMGVALPDEAAAIAPEDTTTVRWAVRAGEQGAFVFLTNYQDHVERHDQTGIRLSVARAGETIAMPCEGELTLPREASAILPIDLSLAGIRLVYATTQPLTILETPAGRDYLFFAVPGMAAEYAFDRATYREIAVTGGHIRKGGERAYIYVEPGTASAITLQSVQSETIRVLTLTREQATHCWTWKLAGHEYVVLSRAVVLAGNEGLTLHSADEAVEFSLYPALAGGLQIAGECLSGTEDGLFARYAVPIDPVPLSVEVTQIGPQWWTIRCPIDLRDPLRDVFLCVDFTGDVAEAYIDGVLIADQFYNGTTWEIGLKRFAERLRETEIVLHVTPLREGGNAMRYIPVGMAVQVEPAGVEIVRLDAVRTRSEYEITVGIVSQE